MGVGNLAASPPRRGGIHGSSARTHSWSDCMDRRRRRDPSARAAESARPARRYPRWQGQLGASGAPDAEGSGWRTVGEVRRRRPCRGLPHWVGGGVRRDSPSRAAKASGAGPARRPVTTSIPRTVLMVLVALAMGFGCGVLTHIITDLIRVNPRWADPPNFSTLYIVLVIGWGFATWLLLRRADGVLTVMRRGFLA